MAKKAVTAVPAGLCELRPIPRSDRVSTSTSRSAACSAGLAPSLSSLAAGAGADAVRFSAPTVARARGLLRRRVSEVQGPGEVWISKQEELENASS